jgi:hypothetical protein
MWPTQQSTQLFLSISDYIQDTVVTERKKPEMKYHPNKSVLFVTFSVEEGLLLLCNPLCLAIIQSCLAAAQSLYDVPPVF